jgi:hypothetical protein
MSSVVPTTAAAITDQQIRALRREALQADDIQQAAICDVALHEWTVSDALLALEPWDATRRIADLTQDEARAECARVIRDAAAQDDSYDAACDERSYGEDCDDQCESAR